MTVDVRSQRTGNLPAETTIFVGRRAEVADVKRLLAESRLVTLTGMGGVGKTRLALRAAAGRRRAFPDGVWVVDLAALSDPALLPQAVAEVFQVWETSQRDALPGLLEHLRHRTLLLVLDNCSHIVSACAQLADTLLKAAPGLRILATSREAMNVADEHLLRVMPLPVPDLPDHPVDTNALGQVPSVALFVDRATAVQRGFTLTPENAATVARICRALDGLPLAIELAAARLRTLSLTQILERLDDRYRLLTTGLRSAPPRHQSLRALIDWSFERLPRDAQLVWLRSSVFAGSFDLAAAEAVCAGDGVEPGNVIDLVAELIDRSILIREEHGGVARYRQVETIRAYGRNRLAALGEEPAVQRRHLAYYQGIAAETARRTFGPGQVGWFARLREEHADLRAALEESLVLDGAVRTGLRMATDLLYHWVNGAHLAEGRTWLDRLLARVPEPSLDRANALWANGWVALLQRDVPAATMLLAEARALGEQLDAPEVVAYATLFTGFAALVTNDVDAALRSYEQALDMHRAIGNAHGAALALNLLALGRARQGDDTGADDAARECLALCEAAGDSWHRAFVLVTQGIRAWRRRDLRAATALQRESLRINRDLGDWLGVSSNVEILARVATAEHRYSRAALLVGVLEQLRRRAGFPLSGVACDDDPNQWHDEIRQALGTPVYDARVAESAARSLDQGIALTLEEKPERTTVARADSVVLTRREREVAHLVAAGRSNREIAKALVIAQRTAETHVENILVKLGFTSRAQIAAWFASHDDTNNDVAS